MSAPTMLVTRRAGAFLHSVLPPRTLYVASHKRLSSRAVCCASAPQHEVPQVQARPASKDKDADQSILLFKAHMANSGNTHVTQLQAIALPLMALGLLALAAEPSVAADLHTPIHRFDLAEDTEFFGNVARYGRYFVTVMLGTGYVMMRPIAAMFKNPVSGILALLAIVGCVVGTKVTLDAMLGLSDQVQYQSAGFM